MGNSETTINCLSICSGIRGIERGLERVISNLRTICHVEIEAFIIENLVAEMEAGMVAPAPVWSNLKTFDPAPFRGMVDILTGGYPCQPFSTAGKRRGAEDPRHLYPYIERAIRIIRPRICFFENVRGHVTCGLPEVIASLEGLGYRVRWGIYSAEETGAAHKRERVFILAIMDDPESRRRLRESFYQRATNREVNAPINSSELGNAAGADKQLERINESSGEKEIGGYGIEELANNRCFRVGEGLGWRPSKQFDENGCKWIVSRPGQPQQAWEHPRVISRKTESLVGLSAHGYHFREDILRALGNSVYSDTAELAFRDLILKAQ